MSPNLQFERGCEMKFCQDAKNQSDINFEQFLKIDERENR